LFSRDDSECFPELFWGVLWNSGIESAGRDDEAPCLLPPTDGIEKVGGARQQVEHISPQFSPYFSERFMGRGLRTDVIIYKCICD